MQFQNLLLNTLGRLSTPEFAALFIGTVISLFLLLEFMTQRHLSRDIHRLIGLAISIGLAILLLAASIGMGQL